MAAFCQALMWNPLFLGLFLFTGAFFTLRSRCFVFRRPLTVLRATFGQMLRPSKGGISPFRALSCSLAACLGTGNIVGVASALLLGGAGSVFWMVLSALLGMATACAENTLGIRQTVAVKGVNSLVHAWAKFFEYFELFKPFVSIGFHTWLILLVCFLGYRKKDRLTVFLTVPCLSIVFSLMIGTPSFAEFRYAYALFCCLPFLAATAFRNTSSKENIKIDKNA